MMIRIRTCGGICSSSRGDDAEARDGLDETSINNAFQDLQ